MKKLLLIAGLVMSVQAISAGDVPQIQMATQQQVDPGRSRLTTFELNFSGIPSIQTYVDESQCRDLAEGRLNIGGPALQELQWKCSDFLKMGK